MKFNQPSHFLTCDKYLSILQSQLFNASPSFCKSRPMSLLCIKRKYFTQAPCIFFMLLITTLAIYHHYSHVAATLVLLVISMSALQSVHLLSISTAELFLWMNIFVVHNIHLPFWTYTFLCTPKIDNTWTSPIVLFLAYNTQHWVYLYL